jgi:hypothetical protein
VGAWRNRTQGNQGEAPHPCRRPGLPDHPVADGRTPCASSRPRAFTTSRS